MEQVTKSKLWRIMALTDNDKGRDLGGDAASVKRVDIELTAN